MLTVRLRYQQNEQKEGGFRAVARSYYFIDYKSFCNVVKWRISQMRRDIDNKLRNVCWPSQSNDHC